jgi:hypothetical protein
MAFLRVSPRAVKLHQYFYSCQINGAYWAAREGRSLRPPAAEPAQSAAGDALDALLPAILAAPAHSLAGLAVKARAVKLWGHPEWWSPQESHADSAERLAAHVLDAVMGMGGA